MARRMLRLRFSGLVDGVGDGEGGGVARVWHVGVLRRAVWHDGGHAEYGVSLGN